MARAAPMPTTCVHSPRASPRELEADTTAELALRAREGSDSEKR